MYINPFITQSSHALVFNSRVIGVIRSRRAGIIPLLIRSIEGKAVTSLLKVICSLMEPASELQHISPVSRSLASCKPPSGQLSESGINVYGTPLMTEWLT